MSSLNEVEKRYFENILEMQTGYVLDYSDATYGEFFKSFNIPIHSLKYQTYGTSKAKKMRSFWDQENDDLVARVLSELLEAYETDCVLNGKTINTPVLDICKKAVSRLKGVEIKEEKKDKAADFLNKEYEIPNLHKLPIEQSLIPIIEARLKEARLALKSGAYLSVIFLCGSVLEAVLLGKAQNEPRT